MHILVTNDDGPPDSKASPYIYEFVKTLRNPPFNHDVSVVIPSQQRSWIGKAHLLPPTPANKEQKMPVQKVEAAAASTSVSSTMQKYSKNEEVDEYVRPVYYAPETGALSDQRPKAASVSVSQSSATHHLDSSKGAGTADSTAHPGSDGDYWVLVPGTPAACTQLGLFHHEVLFPVRSRRRNRPYDQAFSTSTTATESLVLSSPVDLVISGPNHGRNTTAAFALSSGTLGGALEAAVCGTKAIALSFAFFTRNESQEVIREACVLSARICERLYSEWQAPPSSMASGAPSLSPLQPDLFSVNVPLVEGVGEKPIKWTWMLNNKWVAGSLYKALPSDRSGHVPATEQENEPTLSYPMFKWSPNFSDVWKTVEESEPGNDGHAIREHCSSVTPLKANFHGLYGSAHYEGELKL